MPEALPVVARFEFKADRAPEFCYPGTCFAEMQFNEPEEVVELCSQFEDAIVECIVRINGKVVALSEQPTEEA